MGVEGFFLSLPLTWSTYPNFFLGVGLTFSFPKYWFGLGEGAKQGGQQYSLFFVGFEWGKEESCLELFFNLKCLKTSLI